MSYRPDWSEWILQKNNEARQEELKKSEFIQLYFEDLLEKAGPGKLPFQHGSVIHLNRAVSHGGKTHGYEVHEVTPSGETIVHPNINYRHIDTRMTEGRLRMGAENATKKHDKYWAGKVKIGSVRHENGRVEKYMEISPHGECHTKAEE